MENITRYSDNELSLTVYNVEKFYLLRNNLSDLLPALKKEYEFTPKQLKVLLKDILNDKL